MTTLVLLPGLDGACKLRRAFLDALAATFRTVPLDYPIDLANDYASLQEWVIPRLPDDDFLLLGESFGGPLACAVAAARPPGLRGLVLVASFLRRPLGRLGMIAGWLPAATASWAPQWSLRQALFDQRTSMSEIAATQAAVRLLPARRLAERQRAALSVDARDWLPSIDIPLLVLRAGNDRILSSASQDELDSALPGALRSLIEGPHALLQSRPSQCAEAIVRWWQRESPD